MEEIAQAALVRVARAFAPLTRLPLLGALLGAAQAPREGFLVEDGDVFAELRRSVG